MSKSPSRKTPSRHAITRLTAIADRYRAAFHEVQEVLSDSDLGPVPNWVFAIDPLPLETVGEFSEALLAAESRRRKWKTALHAMAELIALEDEGDALTQDTPNTESLIDEANAANLGKLDRFITVINSARAGSCIYVNGTFAPVERDTGPTDGKDTFDLPPTRDETEPSKQ